MTKIQVVELIANILTGVDRCLSDPNLPPDSAEWHQLFALRKALDDQQRELVTAIFQENDADFVEISSRINGLNQQLQGTLDDIQKIASTIATITKVIGAVGQLLSLVHP